MIHAIGAGGIPVPTPCVGVRRTLSVQPAWLVCRYPEGACLTLAQNWVQSLIAILESHWYSGPFGAAVVD